MGRRGPTKKAIPAQTSGGSEALANAKIYTLTEILDLKAALPLAEGLLAQRGSELMIDASQVERLGAQSLQILLSAISTWHADGVSIEFINPSEAFVQSLTLFGIEPAPFLRGAQMPGMSEAAVH